MEYQILCGKTTQELEQEVSEAIAEGWKPKGGVCTTHHEWENSRKGYTESEWVYHQAMVRVSNDES